MLETKKIIFNIDEFNHFVCVIMSVCVLGSKPGGYGRRVDSMHD